MPNSYIDSKAQALAVAGPLSQIGDHTLDLRRQCLHTGSETTQLDPKEFSVLLHLVEAAPATVSTEALLERSWSGTVVGDNVIHQVITRLRKYLGDDARNPTYIETLPKRGYRLVALPKNSPAPASVRQASNTPASRRKRASYMGAAGILCVISLSVTLWLGALSGDGSQSTQTISQSRAVIVFDFDDLSPSGDYQWLARGIAQELRRQLSSSPDFDIVSSAGIQNSDQSQLANAAQFVVSGSVQGADDQFTVYVEATDLSTQRMRLAQSFDVEGNDLLDLQRRISADVARNLDGAIYADQWGPSDPAAYEPFLKWLYYAEGAIPEDTVFWLEETLRADAQWAGGWFNYCWQMIRMWGSSTEPAKTKDYLDRARQYLARGRELGGPPAAARSLESMLVIWVDHDRPSGERMLRETSNAFSYAFMMNATGLHQEAIVALRANLAIYPHTAYWDPLAMAYLENGDLQQAVEASERCASYAPPNSYNCYFAQAYALPIIDPSAAQLLLREIDDTQRTRRLLEVTHLTNNALAAILSIGLARQSGDYTQARRYIAQLPNAFYPKAFFMQAINHPDAEAALASLEPQDHNGMHWTYYRPIVSERDRRHNSYQAYEAFFGYTDQWRQELCQKANLWPPEYHIRCDVEGQPN